MEFIKLHYENNKINNDEFEEYFKQLDIQLANIEKLGSSLLVIGYFFFIHVSGGLWFKACWGDGLFISST